MQDQKEITYTAEQVSALISSSRDTIQLDLYTRLVRATAKNFPDMISALQQNPQLARHHGFLCDLVNRIDAMRPWQESCFPQQPGFGLRPGFMSPPGFPQQNPFGFQPGGFQRDPWCAQQPDFGQQPGYGYQHPGFIGERGAHRQPGFTENYRREFTPPPEPHEETNDTANIHHQESNNGPDWLPSCLGRLLAERLPDLLPTVRDVRFYHPNGEISKVFTETDIVDNMQEICTDLDFEMTGVILIPVADSVLTKIRFLSTGGKPRVDVTVARSKDSLSEEIYKAIIKDNPSV